VNLLGDNTDVMNKYTETLTHATKEDGLEVNGERSKYALLVRHQNAGQNHDTKIANRFLENAMKFKYLRTAIRNQHLVQQENEKQRLGKNVLAAKNTHITIY
jgi:hypothetical protein